MNVFILAMLRIFSFDERWKVLFNWAIAQLNRTFHLSPYENILTIAVINIHYLYIILLKSSSFMETRRVFNSYVLLHAYMFYTKVSEYHFDDVIIDVVNSRRYHPYNAFSVIVASPGTR